MPDPLPFARRGVDAIALTLCALGTSLAIILFSQTGSDRFLPAAGTDGASTASLLRYHLFESLGVAAYFLLAAWVILTAVRLCRPGWLTYGRQVFGWLILIVDAAIICDRIGTPLDGPLIGAGGAIGAEGSTWLEQNCTPFVSLLLMTLSVAAGLFFAARPVVRAIVRSAVKVVRSTFTSLEWLLREIAVSLDCLAIGFRWLANVLGRRLHPETYPVAISPVANPPLWKSPLLSAANKPNLTHRESKESAETLDTQASVTFPRADSSKSDDTTALEGPYDLPSLDLLDEPIPIFVENHEQKLLDVAAHLEKACADFGLTVKVVGIHTGPVITQYEISLDTGMRVSKITSLSDDLALHLKVPSVRIVAPIPGKNTVGIEVPNEQRAVVRMKELAISGSAKIRKSKLPLLLGKDSEGRPLIHDLAEMPHLLIAGRTGTGKSVCLNSIILSLLLTRRPDECKLIMLDPKQVELAEYGRLPHLMHPVVTDNKKAESILSWAVDKMEERYEILRRARVRNIASYNELPYTEILKRVKPVDDDEKKRVPPRMPYIVIVVDEVGDLMMAMKKEVEGHIIRLAQKSRAAGIHLILTTQRPTVDVITGLIKSNLPARIAFQVADRSNSRVVLDEMGAEKLLGKGDMLFLQPNTSTIVRAQGTYASDEEILRIVGKLEVENPTYDSELLRLEDRSQPGKGGMMEMIRKRDEVYEEAIEIVIREGRGSVSLLQRALGIGYGRAARLIDFMAEDGIVGHYNGAQARDVLFTQEQWDEMKGGESDSLAESA